MKTSWPHPCVSSHHKKRVYETTTISGLVDADVLHGARTMSGFTGHAPNNRDSSVGSTKLLRDEDEAFTGAYSPSFSRRIRRR